MTLPTPSPDTESESAQPAKPRRPWRRLVTAAAIVTVIAVIGLWASGVFDDSAQSRAGQQAEDNPTGLTRYQLGDRMALPVVRGETLTGSQLDLADLRGKIVVINVWGSWCNPCRAETPELVKAANETVDQGVSFVGIDTRDNLPAARAFAKAFKMPYPSIIDRDGRILLGFNGIVPFSAVPSTVVVDRSGAIAARVIGRINYSTLRGLIADLQAETASSPSNATPSGSR
ncbi:MAG TPA: TlpA disulfide reductase family protein [Kribbella sp.]|uniref:TlpA family protein disulfide reductase n=1 Tax=Kribbella sp. TaxID=1871183 RepID=UPI002D76F833|nr:TlpA disulfide reductase family protein [Kribbella sp.]HET6293669.1 TlpA disulfide reductase family protein [Kribbella sp.]